MKKLISRIPWINNLIKKFRKTKRPKDFNTSGEYWEERYKVGGNSGAGSYNNLAKFKGEIINNFIENLSST